MTRLFRSKSCGLVGLTEFNTAPPSPTFFHNTRDEDDGEDENGRNEDDDDNDESLSSLSNPISTPLISPAPRIGGKSNEKRQHQHHRRSHSHSSSNHQFPILDILVAALRKSLVCSVDQDDVASLDISYPTDVRHVSHVTFDRFNGFLGLPVELEPELPRRVPSASASVFGVSAESMQCSYDDRGNSVPSILLMMQRRLYVEGGLKAEGIFRINAENSQEEYVRDQLNKGVLPREIDVHCLAGLIKAWLRELPTGVLDSLTPEQVMHCNTEDECTQLIKLLPPTEAALLDWSINLLADVVEHEQYNKMNARNVAMVFAPNMTQMADPLTALIHAVQVMNFLKTLIMKTLREREESATKARLLSSCSDSPSNKGETHSSISGSGESYEQTKDDCVTEKPSSRSFLRTATLNRLECDVEEEFWSFQNKGQEEEEFESVSDNNSTSTIYEMGALENECGDGYDDGDWLSLRKGVRRLCRHPVFQLSKPAKKTRGIGIVNTRGGGGEAWA